MVITEKRLIYTSDGTQLSALVVSSETNNPKAVVQFNSGTVTKKEFYLKLATYLAEQNYIVILYDYRGVGDSRPKKMRGYVASISDWGQYDANAVSHYIDSQYPNLKKHLLAHSMGGQIYGLMETWSSFDKVILLSTSSGNFNKFAPTINRLKVKWPAILLFPPLNALLGYIPGFVGLGQDWPKGVANDWLTNSKENGLMPSYLHNKVGHSYYNKINKKIIAWYFPDDTMSTPSTMEELTSAYPNAVLDMKVVQPSEIGMDKIGHFGIFKAKSKDKLWPMLLKEIES